MILSSNEVVKSNHVSNIVTILFQLLMIHPHNFNNIPQLKLTFGLLRAGQSARTSTNSPIITIAISDPWPNSHRKQARRKSRPIASEGQDGEKVHRKGKSRFWGCRAERPSAYIHALRLKRKMLFIFVCTLLFFALANIFGCHLFFFGLWKLVSVLKRE